MARPKPPLYILPHGIEVIGEYKPSRGARYWRVRIRPHPFFIGVPIIFGGIYVRRSRAIMAAKLGRKLGRDEHVHHIDGDQLNDSVINLALLNHSEHMSLHKTGAKHSKESRDKISAGMKRAWATGTRNRGLIIERDSMGRIVKWINT